MLRVAWPQSDRLAEQQPSGAKWPLLKQEAKKDPAPALAAVTSPEHRGPSPVSERPSARGFTRPADRDKSSDLVRTLACRYM